MPRGRVVSNAVASLVQGVSPEVDSTLKTDLESTEAKLQVLVESANNGEAFDQLIAADNAEGQEKVRNAIAALVKQTASIEQAAAALGISDLNRDRHPDVYISNIVTMDKDEKYILPDTKTRMKFNPEKMAQMRVVEANDLFTSVVSAGAANQSSTVKRPSGRTPTATSRTPERAARSARRR